MVNLEARWPNFALGELCTFLSGGTPSRQDPTFWDGDVPWLSAKDLKTFDVHDSVEKLTRKGASSLKSAPQGSLLLLVRGMTLFKDLPVCVTAREVCFNQDVKALIPKHGVDGRYLALAILERKSMILANVDSAGHGTGRLDTDFLQAFPIPLPALDEQKRISAILRTWDEAIDAAARETELYAEQLRGMRAKLVSWSNGARERLGNIVEQASRATAKPTTAYTALSIRSHGKGTFLRRVEDPDTVEMDTLYLARAGDLIVNITFAWEGAIAIVPEEHDGALVSHRFPTFVPDAKRVFAPFLRHAVRTPRFTYLLREVSPGGAGRNRVLNKQDFLDLELPLPPYPRQKAVAAALDDIERAHILANQRRDTLQRQKRGLMQKLLTGKWRTNGGDQGGRANG